MDHLAGLQQALRVLRRKHDVLDEIQIATEWAIYNAEQLLIQRGTPIDRDARQSQGNAGRDAQELCEGLVAECLHPPEVRLVAPTMGHPHRFHCSACDAVIDPAIVTKEQVVKEA